MTRALQAKLLILAVFVIGGLTGAVGTGLYDARVQPAVEPENAGSETRPDRPPGLQRFLKLTEEQQEQLNVILGRARERYRELQAQTRPLYRDINELSRDEIRAILTDEQRGLYEEWIIQLDRRNRDRNAGGARDRNREAGGDVENDRR